MLLCLYVRVCACVCVCASFHLLSCQHSDALVEFAEGVMADPDQIELLSLDALKEAAMYEAILSLKQKTQQNLQFSTSIAALAGAAATEGGREGREGEEGAGEGEGEGDGNEEDEFRRGASQARIFLVQENGKWVRQMT